MADRTVTYRLSADIGQFKAQMAAAGASVQTAADRMTGATKEGAKFRLGLDQAGAAAGKIGLVAAAGLGAAVLVAANFDQAMSRVQAATGESAANMEALRGAAIKAGQDTAFSASEAAAGIEELAKAGVTTNDILNGGLNGALDLAAAGSISVGEAAETAARAMTQFGLSGEEVPHVADLLAAAAGKASGEVSDFGMALNQSGLVADQVGVTIEETTGALAAFASAGLQGSDAGTSFKTMLGSLTPNSEKAKAAMESLGISAYDAQGNFIGLAEFAGRLQGALSGMTAEQRQATLETIFGSDAVRAASVLYEQGEDGIRKWTAAVDDQGYAAETAATKLDNLKGDLEAFRGSLETALIGTGDGAQTPLRNLVQSLTDVVNAYNKLPDAAQGAVSGMLGITAVLGGGLWFGSKVVQGIADTRTALADLRVTAGATRTALSLVGKGLIVAAALEGVKLLSDALTDLGNLEFDQSNLQRSLEALAGGEVLGAVADTWGEDLAGMNDDLDALDNNMNKMTDWVPKYVPGLSVLSSATEHAEENFRAMDEALASMVEAGQGEQAAAIFEALAAEAERGGNSVEQLKGLFEQYGIAVRNAGDGSTWIGDAISGLVPDLERTGRGFRGATEAGQGFKQMLEDLNGLLDKRDAIRQYAASMEDLRATVADYGPASREAAEGFDAIARNIGVVASHMKRANKVEFLASATDELRTLARQLGIAPAVFNPVINRLLDTARAADKTSGAQRELITQYHLTPQQVETAIKQINMGKSKEDIRALLKSYGLTPKEIRTAIRLLGTAAAEAEINNATRDRTVTVRYSFQGRPSDPRLGAADGGIFTFADGGYTPSIGAQSPQIRPYTGPTGLTWSEEGSGPWEAFISGHPGKAARSRDIASEVVARLGGQAFFASGGMVGGPLTPTVTVPASVRLSDSDVQRIATAIRTGSREGVVAGMSSRGKAATADRRIGGH